jgi:hypothetical protein
MGFRWREGDEIDINRIRGEKRWVGDGGRDEKREGAMSRVPLIILPQFSRRGGEAELL